MTGDSLKTLIIGCGRIAGGFDINQKNLPLTHIGAYRHHGKFEVNNCIDPDEKIRKEFEKYWHVENSFSSIYELTKHSSEFDVISICSSTSYHYENILEAIKLKPKLIFCEKPLASNYKDAIKIKDICNQAGIKLAVNHSRRWDPRVISLKNDITSGVLGDIRSVIAYYNKGILNNGSHMVDLLLYFFGSLNIVNAILPVNDFYDDDPTLSALLKTNSDLPIHLVASNASEYALFELEIIGSKKTISMRDGGLNWSSRSIIDNSRFEDYKILSKDQYSKGSYDESMTNAVKNIYNAITQNEKLLCTGKEACEAHKICDELHKKANLN